MGKLTPEALSYERELSMTLWEGKDYLFKQDFGACFWRLYLELLCLHKLRWAVFKQIFLAQELILPNDLRIDFHGKSKNWKIGCLADCSVEQFLKIIFKNYLLL